MSKKYKVKVPATTANLGPGFDCLGAALDIYNEFIFEASEDYKFININKEYANKDNLVVQSALKTFKYLKKKEIPFSLEIVENVPIARGMGSSATCIIAGITIAMLLSQKDLSDEEIIDIATSIEGHPDNVSPAYYGNLVASIKCDDHVICSSYSVSNDLIFTVLIPDFELSTEKARGVLPNTISYSDMIYSMSRAINIPKVLEDGDLEKLFVLLNDKIHEPYRYELIEDSLEFKKLSEKYQIPMCISGSGSTLLMISKESLLKKLNKLNTKHNWEFKELKICDKGTSWVKIDG